MIRPGGTLLQPQFDRVRQRIEWAIRFVVLAFGVFFFFVLTFPLGKDLLLLTVGQKPLRITRTLEYGRSGGRAGNPVENIGLSDDVKEYQLYYPTKALRVGHKYEFVVLPNSRIILDYGESNER